MPTFRLEALLTLHRYHVPSHIQEHVDYITPGIKLFAPKRPRGTRRDMEGDIEKRGPYKLPPLLKSLGMTIEALLAIPELLVCSVAITPACVQSS
jgi:tripeptidyl-peptidase-1